MEMSHTLTVTGNLFVDGGGDPIVSTLGAFSVLTKLVVPVQAQGISTSGGSSGPSAASIAAAVRAELMSPSLPVDVRSVNGVPLRGTGVPGDSMRPL